MVNIGVLGFAHGHISTIAGEWINKPQYGVGVLPFRAGKWARAA